MHIALHSACETSVDYVLFNDLVGSRHYQYQLTLIHYTSTLSDRSEIMINYRL